MLRYKTKLDLF